MHEMTLARNILEIVHDLVPTNNLAGIDSVELNIGMLSNVLNDSLKFCFNALIENTPLASAKLKINSLPVKIRCLDCNSITESMDFIFTCSFCAGNNIEVQGGNELHISGIIMKSTQEF